MFDKLCSLLADQLAVNPDGITKDSLLEEDLGVDPDELMSLAMSVEEAFGIEMADEDVENLRTVGDLYRYISDALD